MQRKRRRRKLPSNSATAHDVQMNYVIITLHMDHLRGKVLSVCWTDVLNDITKLTPITEWKGVFHEQPIGQCRAFVLLKQQPDSQNLSH